MKKLSLDETWKNCLKMWRWIAKEKKANSRLWVNVLKRKWLLRHNFSGPIRSHCFFCEYAVQDCIQCPARKIDRDFWCMNSEYHHRRRPADFLREITCLNKIRLAKKKK